jgi:hypothetical protein
VMVEVVLAWKHHGRWQVLWGIALWRHISAADGARMNKERNPPWGIDRSGTGPARIADPVAAMPHVVVGRVVRAA